jgi:hypothetical protein
MNAPNPSITALSGPGDTHSQSPDRCRHLTVRGRRCRSRAIRSGFCFRHAALQLQSNQPVDTDLSADFLLQLDDLQSADNINLFLSKLLILVVQNRISSRRAAVLTYITNQLLHSLAAIQRQVDQEPVQVIMDGICSPDFPSRDPHARATVTPGAPGTTTPEPLHPATAGVL